MKDKTVLITGGTGSFGKTVGKHLLKNNTKKVIVYSRDEEKQWRMKHVEGYRDFAYIVGDVRDKDRLLYAMRDVDIVFHAAALKQVPICEFNPDEAMKTNILGSKNVCDAAIQSGVERVVALSTDKAVNPINTMGLSKAFMEKIVCSYNMIKSDTIFCCTRYGNVLGSRGSVIPFFVSRIKNDMSLTITDPNMTRFVMSLDEAVDLVFYAMQNAKGGEIFVKKAPACTVDFIADSLIKYYNKNTQKEVIGIRPGEKIHETLVNEFEYRRSEQNENFFTIYPEYKDFTLIDSQEYRSDNTRLITDYEEFIRVIKEAGIQL